MDWYVILEIYLRIRECLKHPHMRYYAINQGQKMCELLSQEKILLL